MTHAQPSSRIDSRHLDIFADGIDGVRRLRDVLDHLAMRRQAPRSRIL